jgi:hypothetical protein
MEEDKLLLEIYMIGWKDSFKNINQPNKYKDFKRKAYNLGWCHAIIGDDLSHIDLLSNEEILKQIKDEKA